MPRSLPRLLLAAAALMAGVCLIGQTAAGYPEPATISPTWKLEFTYQDPQAVAVRDISGNIRWYWFMVYKVVNHSGADQLFIPEVSIATDTGRIISAGRDVPAAVYPEVARRLRNDLLESPIEAVGRILQGEDYAKESVFIWPAFADDVDEFSVFIAGLSGENATFVNPLTGEEVLVRRTLMINYQTPGNHPTPERQPVIKVSESEVMR